MNENSTFPSSNLKRSTGLRGKEHGWASSPPSLDMAN